MEMADRLGIGVRVRRRAVFARGVVKMSDAALFVLGAVTGACIGLIIVSLCKVAGGENDRPEE